MSPAEPNTFDLGRLGLAGSEVTNPIGGPVGGTVPGDGLNDWTFRGTQWNGVDGHGADLTSLDIASSVICDSRLPGSDWSSASVAEIVVADTDLGGAAFTDASLRRAVFSACKLAGAHFFGANLVRVRFERCQMRRCEFNRCSFEDVIFRDCDLTGSLFTHSSVAPNTRLDLRGSDLGETSGLAGVGSLVVDEDQAEQIAAAYLRERGVQVGPDTHRIEVRRDAAASELRRHVMELTRIELPE